MTATMREAVTDPILSPTAPAERIDALDLLRGFALLGIAMVNVEFFTRPLQDINAPGIDPALHGLDYLADGTTYFLMQGKFWTLFALLFGMGFAVMIERAYRAGRAFVPVYLRRSLALLGIGVVHAVLIWAGDILVSYAISAFALLAARQVRRSWLHWRNASASTPMSASRLGAWGIALYSLPLLLILAVGLANSLGAPPSAQERAEQAAQAAAETAERARALVAYSQGSYAEAVVQRVRDTQWQLDTLPVVMVLIVGLFLLGAAILRSGVLSDLRTHQAKLRSLRNLGLPLGLGMMAISTWLGTASPSDEMKLPDAVQVVLYLAASLVLAMAYAATLLLWRLGPAGAWLQATLAPAGRMALTNYLTQSVVGTLLFFHYGLGLWGQAGRATQTLGVFVVFALQIAFSRWWLARFRYGPAEWVWRCITYWRVVPLRS